MPDRAGTHRIGMTESRTVPGYGRKECPYVADVVVAMHVATTPTTAIIARSSGRVTSRNPARDRLVRRWTGCRKTGVASTVRTVARRNSLSRNLNQQARDGMDGRPIRPTQLESTAGGYR